MKRVIQILMERDGISRKEAIELISQTREELLQCDPFEADEIMMSMLGLEPDFILDIL